MIRKAMNNTKEYADNMYSDKLHSPHATVKAGVGVIIMDSDNRILLERRSDNGLWGLSGGAIDPGETIINAAMREAKEETNLDIEITGMVGVYSDPADGRIVTYPDNGDVRHLVDVILTAKVISGKMRKSHESLDLSFFHRESLPSDIARPALRPIHDFLEGKTFVIR